MYSELCYLTRLDCCICKLLIFSLENLKRKRVIILDYEM